MGGILAGVRYDEGMEARKPGVIRALQWVLGIVCLAVLAFTVLAALETPPPRDPTQTDEWDGFGEALVHAALGVIWLLALAPAAALLAAIRIRSRLVSWTALGLASLVFVLAIAVTVADGLEGPHDLRPFLLATFAAVLLLAVTPRSRAYLRLTAERNERR